TAVYCDGTYTATPPGLTANDIYASNGVTLGGVCAGLGGSNGNISADPLFRSPGDYHLLQGSPAVDSGVANQAPATDIEGNARPIQGTSASIAPLATVTD